MGQDDTDNMNGGQAGGQPGGQPGGQGGGQGGQTGGTGGGQQGQSPQAGEDRSFQGGAGDPAEGERIDTDNDGRTRDPNDTRPTDDGGRGSSVDR
jgi:hypothetical protein